MSLGMTARASHVALGDLGLDRRPRRSRPAEVQPLDDTGAMIEVQACLSGAAVQAPVFALVGVQPFAALANVAIDVDLVCRRVLTVARRLSLLVSLPRLGRVVGLAACHRPIVPRLDYWGDESLGTAEMPEAVA